MRYLVVIIGQRDEPEDAAFMFPLLVNDLRDFERGVRESLAEWRRQHGGRNPLDDKCTLLIEAHS